MKGEKFKMKFRLGFIILICITVLVGCSIDHRAKENEYSYEDVIDAFESQNLKLAPLGMVGGNVLTLNKVVPELSYIENDENVDDSNPEYIYFYIFKTEAARKSGVKEFNNQMQTAKLVTYPNLYEKGNVLAIYWAKSKEKPLRNESIHSAINNL